MKKKKGAKQIWVTAGFEIGERRIQVGASKNEKVGLLVDKGRGVVLFGKKKGVFFFFLIFFTFSLVFYLPHQLFG